MALLPNPAQEERAGEQVYSGCVWGVVKRKYSDTSDSEHYEYEDIHGFRCLRLRKPEAEVLETVRPVMAVLFLSFSVSVSGWYLVLFARAFCRFSIVWDLFVIAPIAESDAPGSKLESMVLILISIFF